MPTWLWSVCYFHCFSRFHCSFCSRRGGVFASAFSRLALRVSGKAGTSTSVRDIGQAVQANRRTYTSRAPYLSLSSPREHRARRNCKLPLPAPSAPHVSITTPSPSVVAVRQAAKERRGGWTMRVHVAKATMDRCAVAASPEHKPDSQPP